MARSSAKKSLLKTHPAIAKQAYGWDPKEITSGSSKKLQWKCPEHPKHIWLATPGNRTHSLTGCPFCSGKRTLKGYNDLATKFPKIAKEAYRWDPTLVSGGEKKSRKWKCSVRGKHIWVARTANRTVNKTGCPYCSGQKVLKGDNDLATTYPKLAKEAFGWDPTKIVAGSAKNLKWKCQKDSKHIWVARVETRSIRNYGCPFCSGKKLAKNSNDLKTTHPNLAKEAFGWDPRTITASSTKRLKWKCNKNPKHIWVTSPSVRNSRGVGCPNCVGKAIKVGTDDLASKFPKIAKEALGWSPKDFTSASGKKLEWRCSSNRKHIWITSPAARTTGLMSGCPYCSNRRILQGDNDLMTTHPKLAKEAYKWDPSTVSAGMDKSRRWKCPKNSTHIWSARVSHRALGKTGCPTCAVSGFHPEQEGYLYLMSHPKWKMLQIGITNYPAVRLQQHRSRGWKLIELSKPMEGLIARKLESSILKVLKNDGADLANYRISGKFDGYTESWTRNSHSARSLKELIALGKKHARSQA